MRGHFEDSAGGVVPSSVNGAGAPGVYQDPNGIKWTVARLASGNWSGRAVADNAYGLPAGREVAAASDQASLVDAIDEWADLYHTDRAAALAQVGIKSTTPAPASANTDSGAAILMLIVLVAFVMSDKRGR